jgi:AraC-like DNA-binding protein
MRKANCNSVIVARIDEPAPVNAAGFFSLVLVLEGKIRMPERLGSACAPFIACLKPGEQLTMETRKNGNHGFLVRFRPEAVNGNFECGIPEFPDLDGDPCLAKDIELIEPFVKKFGIVRELIPQETEFLEQILRKSHSLYCAKDDPYWLARIEAFLREALCFLRQEGRDEPGEGDSRAVQLRDFIHAHYQEKLGLDGLARRFGTNRTTLQRLFKAEYDENIFEYVALYRISVAMKLARSTDLTMKEIGYRVGFKDYSHFFREFSRRCGVSPIEFRKTEFTESIGA